MHDLRRDRLVGRVRFQREGGQVVPVDAAAEVSVDIGDGAHEMRRMDVIPYECLSPLSRLVFLLLKGKCV